MCTLYMALYFPYTVVQLFLALASVYYIGLALQRRLTKVVLLDDLPYFESAMLGTFVRFNVALAASEHNYWVRKLN